MKIVKSLEKSTLSIKGVSKTIKNKAKEWKGRNLGMLLCTLGASLLGNLLTGKGAIAWHKGEVQLEQVKVHLELMKALLEQLNIFNATSIFNKFRNN